MKKRSAFTLIEMLMVVTIIAVLAALAVSSYGLANQKAKLDVLADTIVSVLKQRQSLVKNGKGVLADDGRMANGSQEFQPLCYGLLFDTTEKGNKAVQYIEAPYLSVSGMAADVCDVAEIKKRDFEQMNKYLISGIKKNESDLNNITILFKPPFARTMLLNDNLPLPSGASVIDITLKSENQNETRVIRFDTASNVIERI